MSTPPKDPPPPQGESEPLTASPTREARGVPPEDDLSEIPYAETDGPRFRQRGAPISPEEWADFVALCRSGLTYSKAGMKLGWSRNTAAKVWAKGLGYGEAWGADIPVRALLAGESVEARTRKDREEILAAAKAESDNRKRARSQKAMARKKKNQTKAKPSVAPAEPRERTVAEVVAMLVEPVGKTRAALTGETLADRLRKAREDSVRVRAQEMTMVETGRITVTKLLASIGKWSGAVEKLGAHIETQLDKAITDQSLKLPEAVAIFHKIQQSTRGTVEMIHRLVQSQAALTEAEKSSLGVAGNGTDEEFLDRGEAVRRLTRIAEAYTGVTQHHHLRLVRGGQDGQPLETEIGVEPDFATDAFKVPEAAKDAAAR